MIILIGHRPRFCIQRPGMEGVLWESSVRGRLSGRGGAFVDATVIDRCRSRHVGRMEIGKLLVTWE